MWRPMTATSPQPSSSTAATEIETTTPLRSRTKQASCAAATAALQRLSGVAVVSRSGAATSTTRRCVAVAS
jgi:hypothetical protein